jgi:hypothetical protein
MTTSDGHFSADEHVRIISTGQTGRIAGEDVRGFMGGHPCRRVPASTGWPINLDGGGFAVGTIGDVEKIVTTTQTVLLELRELQRLKVQALADVRYARSDKATLNYAMQSFEAYRMASERLDLDAVISAIERP